MAQANTSLVYSDVSLVDGASLHDATEIIAERFRRSRVTVEYSALRETLDKIRTDAGWRSAAKNSIVLSVDPESEPQQRFSSMLRHSGFQPDIVNFRDAFISLPAGRSPNEGTKSQVSLSARIAYIAGLQARYGSGTQFLVVTHAFELYAPLADLANRVKPDGKVALAYFGSLLDYRWRLAGIVEPNTKLNGNRGVHFFDLDEFSEQLVGIKLGRIPHDKMDSRTGGLEGY